jgi:LemA protein
MQWLLLILVIAVVAFVISAYNRLIALKGETLNAWKQIDVQLKRRHDLIPNLVNAVKGAMEFEKDTLEAVIQARNQAVKVQANASPTGGIQALAGAEAALGAALSRLNVVVERYPQLKATGNIGQLQEELTSTENRVAFARQLYNDTATTYNVKQQQFPWNLVAGFAKAETVELYEIEEPKEREVPAVDLSMKPKA